MKVKFFSAFFLLGTAIPLMAFYPWLTKHGLNLNHFIQEIFSTDLGAFFGWDVLLSAVVLVFVIFSERHESHRFWILPAILTLSVGVSSGLPLYFLLKEIKKKND